MALFKAIRDWCRGRSALARLPVLLYLAYIGYREYLHPVDATTTGSVNLFAAINLCIHEGGHLLMRPLGNEFMHVAGGTALQLLAPLICLLVLLRQSDYFGIPVCLGWLSTNMVGVGVYMADARAQELPLVTAEGAGSSDAIITHDWAYLFGYFNILPYDVQIGTLMREAGTVMMALAIIIGTFILGLMLVAGEKPKDGRAEQRAVQFRRRGF